MEGQRNQNRNRKFLAGSMVLLFITACIAVFCGRYSVTPFDVWNILRQKNENVYLERVIFQIRLPRILFAMAAGAGLAAAGAAMQGSCANPLATPDTLGVANGAAFGAALGILFGWNGFWIQVLAMFFGISAVLLVLGICRRTQSNSVLMLVLGGMTVSSLFSALLSLVKYTADPQDVLPSITHWLLGSLNTISWQTVWMGLPWIAAGTILIWLLRWRLDALLLSEEEAAALGVPVRTVRLLSIGAASVITAAVVAACGQIGWIGLLIPHCCRLLFGEDYRRIIPAGLVFGAGFLLLADTAARSMTAAEIPAAILISLVGAPAFCLLLMKQIKRGGERVF